MCKPLGKLRRTLGIKCELSQPHPQNHQTNLIVTQITPQLFRTSYSALTTFCTQAIAITQQIRNLFFTHNPQALQLTTTKEK